MVLKIKMGNNFKRVRNLKCSQLFKVTRPFESVVVITIAFKDPPQVNRKQSMHSAL